jgi:hypothetical protein
VRAPSRPHVAFRTGPRTDRERPDLFCFFLLADFHGDYPGYSVRIKKPDYLTWAVLKAFTRNTAGTVSDLGRCKGRRSTKKREVSR